jgi:hypothetical protein
MIAARMGNGARTCNSVIAKSSPKMALRSCCPVSVLQTGHASPFTPQKETHAVNTILVSLPRIGLPRIFISNGIQETTVSETIDPPVPRVDRAIT